MKTLRRVRLWAPPHKWDGREVAVPDDEDVYFIQSDKGDNFKHVKVAAAPDGADIFALEGFAHLWNNSERRP